MAPEPVRLEAFVELLRETAAYDLGAGDHELRFYTPEGQRLSLDVVYGDDGVLCVDLALS